MKHLIEDLRSWLASIFLRWSLRVFAVVDSERIGLLRGLREQREYDRYEAYARLLGVTFLSFDSWRCEREWIGLKVTSAYPVHRVS